MGLSLLPPVDLKALLQQGTIVARFVFLVCICITELRVTVHAAITASWACRCCRLRI